jgi:hypothetical protein
VTLATNGRGRVICERESGSGPHGPDQVSRSDTVRKRKRISGFVLNFTNNVEKEDKLMKIDKGL